MNQWIREAEKKWLDPLYQNALRLFEGTFLPSHDQEHHLRVWNICKNLLLELSGFNNRLDPDLVEGLMVAAWFHDLGMSLKTDMEHGSLGRKMCEKFFLDHALRKPERYGELLEAIEKHDLKEEPVYAVFVPENPPGILDILSIADDLDAFGIIGIYRYAEIYLHRNIPLHLLGIRILENARKRYGNMVNSCIHCPSVVSSYRGQYDLLVEFFNLYNQQMLVHSDPQQIFRGHLGIINHIRLLGVEGLVRPEHYLQKLDGAEAGATVQSYFNELKDELDSASVLHRF
jgi:HD superfamily phosphodiesterase